ncbi:MAG: 30S ribosomal protein S9 [Candidatus Aenigmarchaeota archaeon]|nr:30S ribosomal protein S9 [Candidatus Aenigmarchaeota archaeon]
MASEIFVGKRRLAVSRVKLTPGNKRIVLNDKLLEAYPKTIQLKIQEPLIVIGEDGFDIRINAAGGGIISQAEAAAQGIARAIVSLKGDEAKKAFLDYDRALLVQDPRRAEPHKPSRSKKGARRHKQRSKR